jgi:hypothetical protein
MRLQNLIFYFAYRHPCAEMVKDYFTCRGCNRIKDYHNMRCFYCIDIICSSCDTYEEVQFHKRKMRLCCYNCMNEKLEYFVYLHQNEKTTYHRGLFIFLYMMYYNKLHGKLN